MINEKRLMARMREIFKTAGYRVGNIMEETPFEEPEEEEDRYGG